MAVELPEGFQIVSRAAAPERPAEPQGGGIQLPEGFQIVSRAQQPAPEQPPEPQRPTSILPAPVAELASSAVRGITEGIDFVTTDAANAALRFAGSDLRVPRLTDAVQSVGGGVEDFMEPGLARDVVQATGEWSSAVGGLAGAARKIPGAAERAVSLFSRESETTQAISELAEQGNRQAQDLARRIQVERSGDVATARQTVDEAGQIVRDKLAGRAIRQGFDEGVIAAVKASTPETRQSMSQMVDILEKGRGNRRYAVTHRPTDVVGDAIGGRVNTIRQANQRAAQDLEREAQALAGNPVDIAPAVDDFIADLERLGVTLDENLRPVFEGSDLEGIGGAERAIKLVMARVRRLEANPDAFEAHRLKRYIDEQVTFGKNTEGLAGRGEAALKALRRGVDQVLDANFDGYRQANDSYSETIRALDAFQDVAGRKIDLTGPNAEKAVGTLSRRLMSNVQSRVALLNALEDLDTVAAKYGGKRNDDVLALALFADELDAVFKPVARTSLGGELAKTAATEGQSGLVRKGAERAVDLAMRRNEAEALKAIKELLAR